MNAEIRPGDARLEGFIAIAAGATRATILRAELLGGGAIQQNWLVDARIEAEIVPLVVRTDGRSTLVVSHGRKHEFALQRAAYDAGVTVAEPLWLSEDPSLIGTPFFVMRRVPGTAAPARILRERELGGDRSTLAQRLGDELARIHEIVPPRLDLSFLPQSTQPPARAMVESLRAILDAIDGARRPVLEWALRWLEREARPAEVRTLCHRDFRTGNYMLDETGIAAILDWEFAGWGDPFEDIGWFCARCWRFGAPELEAGGIGTREAFYRGYERRSGRRVDPAAVHYYEVAAHLRWAVIALLQARRHLGGAEFSLELALTAHIVPELELELLALTRIARCV